MNLDELRNQSEIVQRHIDTINNLLALASLTQNNNQLRALKLLMERESLHMQSESDKLSEMMSAFREERTTMKRTALMSAVLVILMFVLVAGLPVVAQDSPLATNTPAVVTIQTVEASVNDVPVEATLVAPVEQPPVVVVDSPQSTAMFWIFSAVIFGLLVVIVLVLRPLIVQLGASAPRWAVDAAFSAGGTLLNSAQTYAGTTLSTIDDDLVAELRKEVDSLKSQIEQMRINKEPTAATAAVNPPGTYLFEKLPGDGDGGVG